jgi:hypothetical protein
MTGTGHIVSFANLADVDLVLDRVYQGGRRKNASDDPLPRLLRVSNSGGFRIGERSIVSNFPVSR